MPSQKRHNPERKAFRGRSYKKGGALVTELAQLQEECGAMEAMASLDPPHRARFNYIKQRIAQLQGKARP